MPGRIVYDREHCEGYFLCVAQDGEDFGTGDDNKADLLGGTEASAGLWTKDLPDDAIARACAGAQVCPPRVIKVIDPATGQVLEGPEKLPVEEQAPTP